MNIKDVNKYNELVATHHRTIKKILKTGKHPLDVLYFQIEPLNSDNFKDITEWGGVNNANDLVAHIYNFDKLWMIDHNFKTTSLNSKYSCRNVEEKLIRNLTELIEPKIINLDMMVNFEEFKQRPFHDSLKDANHLLGIPKVELLPFNEQYLNLWRNSIIERYC